MSASRLPVPHHPQLHDGECLAASALMVLDYLGLTVDYEQLLQMLEIQWFGVSFIEHYSPPEPGP